jgi:tRNA threonylcarbamoyladenosine biosynthesis protein TsaB
MDARRDQVYAAIFRQLEAAHNVNLTRVTPDEALSISELAEKLKEYDEPIMLVGDGAELCYSAMHGSFHDITLAPANLLHQRASGVCAVAAGMTELTSPAELAPFYLRLPQAERERLKSED